VATSADVPGKFDVVINNQGYVFLDSIEPSLPFRTHRAVYTYSPTFVTRTNVSGSYGDNQQDFWLTFAQRDWSPGETLKYARPGDTRYWQGTNVDVSKPGQVSMCPAVKSVTFAGSVTATFARQGSDVSTKVAALSDTNFYEIDGYGAITDKGAHGLGARPSAFAAVTDGLDFYFSTTTAGTVGVRKIDNAGVFTTFSATSCDSLAFLNNTLFGVRNNAANTQELGRYDTAGAYTSLFTWKQADGGLGNLYDSPRTPRLEPMAGKLYVLWGRAPQAGAELWVYDGNGVTQIASLPVNFFPYDMENLYGIMFISGTWLRNSGASSLQTRPGIYYYASGQIGELWRAEAWTTSTVPLAFEPALISFNGGLVFNDDSTGHLMNYNPAIGGVSSIGTYTVAGSQVLMGANYGHLLMTRAGTGAYLYPDSVNTATNATITSALIDFESSLDKYFKAVKVDFVAASDGDGGSVDISYRLNDLDGSYTNVQTGATAGTEYTIGQSGRAISIKITLNKGTSTLGPVLKRVNVRAAPILQQFRRREYVLDLSGTTKTPQQLRDGTYHPKSGRDQANDLVTASQLTTPFSITDRFGTFTGLIDLNDSDGFSLFEIHPSPDEPVKSGSFVAQIMVREV
jgi:hypothetical protein